MYIRSMAPVDWHGQVYCLLLILIFLRDVGSQDFPGTVWRRSLDSPHLLVPNDHQNETKMFDSSTDPAPKQNSTNGFNASTSSPPTDGHEDDPEMSLYWKIALPILFLGTLAYVLTRGGVIQRCQKRYRKWREERREREEGTGQTMTAVADRAYF